MMQLGLYIVHQNPNCFVSRFRARTQQNRNARLLLSRRMYRNTGVDGDAKKHVYRQKTHTLMPRYECAGKLSVKYLHSFSTDCVPQQSCGQ